MGKESRKPGDFGVMLASEILTYAEYAAVSEPAQALKFPRLSTFEGAYGPLLIGRDGRNILYNELVKR